MIKVRSYRTAVIDAGLANVHNLIDFVGAHHGIDLRHLHAQVALETLHQAARHDELFGAPHLFELGHLEDGVHGLFLGRVNKRAGVDDDDVSVLGMRGQFVATGGQVAHHHLGIHQVLGTA